MAVVARIQSVAGLVAEITDDSERPIRQTDRSFGLHTLNCEVPAPFTQTAQAVAAELAIAYLRDQGIEAELEVIDPEYFEELPGDPEV